MRHSAIPRCIHTPNLEFLPQEYRRYAPDTKRDGRTHGRTHGRTDGRTDSAITICLPKFLWGHKKSCLIICKNRIKLCFHNKYVHYSRKLHGKVNYLIKTGDFSLVGNYLRPSNSSRQLIFNINAVVLIE